MQEPVSRQGHDHANFDLLMNLSLHVTAELGKCTLSVRDILAVGAGSIVELDRSCTDPVELLVNRKPLARGEIVAVGANFGVRITELIDPAA